MDKATKKRLRVKRAKNSALGRMFCRLLGDQTGAVMMEYIVLAVLLVAATVGIVVVFGRNMRAQWYTAMLAMMGKTDSAETNQKGVQDAVTGDANAANQSGNATDGNQGSSQKTFAE